MANKYLKTLTLDGTPMDTEMTKFESKSGYKEVNITSAWQTVEGASVTITGAGLYIVKAQVAFPNATTTGNTMHSVVIRSSLVSSDLCKYRSYDATEFNIDLFAFVTFTRINSISEDITVYVQSARPLNGKIATGLIVERIYTE